MRAPSLALTLMIAGTLPAAPAAAEQAAMEGAACSGALGGTELPAQLACLAELRGSVAAAEGDLAARAAALGEVGVLLTASSAGSDAALVASALDVLRAAGPDPAAPVEAVSGLLPYRSPLYSDRDKVLVTRLRAYLLATLCDIGVPDSAFPVVLDVLVHADEYTPTLELAAAARAAGRLGPRGRPFIPYLLQAIYLDSAAEAVSLERFAARFPSGEATTAQREAVRSLGRLATPADHGVVATLGRLAGYRGDEWDRELVEDSRLALARITGAAPDYAATTGDGR